MPIQYKKIFTLCKKTYSYIITGNKSFIPRIIKDFSIPAEKVRYIGFGSSFIEKLKENIQYKNIYKQELGIDEDEIVITCGHNSIERQNHLPIIKSISSVQFKNKKILIVIPFALSKNKEYFKNVENAMKETKLKYRILTKYLSDDDVMKYRIVNDIFIHMQESDSFSTAMAEYFYCGSVVINADWLRYDEFEENGGMYVKSSFESLTLQIQKIFDEIDKYKNLAMQNSKIIWELKSWTVNIQKWVNLYK